jgi:hypothetical protein
MKFSFCFNFILFPENKIKDLVSFSETTVYYSQIYQENQELHLFLCSYSACFDSFEMFPSNNHSTLLTQEQKEIIHQYPVIHLLN